MAKKFDAAKERSIPPSATIESKPGIHRSRRAKAGQEFLDLLAQLSRRPELTDQDAWRCIEDAAERTASAFKTSSALDQLEARLRDTEEQWPLGSRIAARLARSRLVLSSRREPVRLSVVIPVYGERERLLAPTEHPLGEEWLEHKFRQLEWLSRGLPEVSWDVTLVDDGCPQESGRLIADLLAQRYPETPAKVLFLEEALRARHPALEGLHDASDSRKGGAVQLGLWEAAKASGPASVILFSDADLSTHLGQAGLLVEGIRQPGKAIAAGSRRDNGSIAVKEASRDARGRLFIYLWKLLAPRLAYLQDTQCGFKAIHPKAIRRLLPSVRERGFAFDFELLALCESTWRASVQSVPIAWIDSPAASTTAERDPYLGMLRSFERISRSDLGRPAHAEPLARIIRSLTEATWAQAVETIAPRLRGIPPHLDSTVPRITARDLAILPA